MQRVRTQRNKKTVALSITKAEYMAVRCTAQEAIWIGGFANKRPTTAKQSLLYLWSDNKSAIGLATHSSQHSKSKHIDRC